MTINFALSLSFEGITLLQRDKAAWRSLGDVAVNSPTLEAELAQLRETGAARAADGLRCKLIIPPDQIKYTQIDGPAATPAEIAEWVAAKTPYSAEELVIDHMVTGAQTQIAAVSKLTLQEAEAFADGHGFNPVSFVAIPPEQSFQREVFFGPTQMMPQLLGPSGTVGPDDVPVVFHLPEIAALDAIAPGADDTTTTQIASEIIETVKSAATAAPAEPDPMPKATALDDAMVAPTPARIDPVIAEFWPQPAATAITPAPPAAPLRARRPDSTAPAAAPVKPGARPLPSAAMFAAAAALVFVAVVVGTSLARDPDDRVAESAPPATQPAETPAPPQPAPAVTASAPAEPAEAASDAPMTALSSLAATDANAALPARIIRPEAELTAQPDQNTPAPPVGPAPQPPLQVIAAPEMATVGLSDLPVPASLSRARRPAFEALGPVADTDLPPLAATAPMAAPPDLTAEIAETPSTPAAADAPIAAAASLAPAPDQSSTVSRPAILPIAPTTARIPTPDEAAAIYAATGVWLRPPRVLEMPSTGAVPQITVSAPLPLQTAPLQRPQPAALSGDIPLPPEPNPPGPDARFAFDDRGFILATAEGTLTPAGLTVFAGLPDLPFVPRPALTQEQLDRMALFAAAPPGVVIIPGAPPALPPLRPANAAIAQVPTAPAAGPAAGSAGQVATASADGITAGSVGLGAFAGDASALPGDADQTGATGRPQPRPDSLLTSTIPDSTPDITDIIADITAENATLRFSTATSLAVTSSLRPDARPGNFGSVVTNARNALARQLAAAATPAQPAAPAPRNASAAGDVARAATQEDVIRLRDINLIGVYGRPNARRALVRLGNGRFIRVEVGSAIDGGQVTAIGETALNYVKRGQTYAIEMPGN